jgi:acyl-CoA thioesterase-2
VASDREVNSLHAYFLRPGKLYLPLTFAVERLHDGVILQHRRVQVHQRTA